MELNAEDVSTAHLACLLAISNLERLRRKDDLSSVGYQQLADLNKLKIKLSRYIDKERIDVGTYCNCSI